MRHGFKFNHLGRKRGHRKALLKNLTCALIKHKRINTTLAKAKALRVYAEPLITKGRSNTTHNRRTVFSYLQSKEAIQELFDVISLKIGDRPGGYLRIIKTGFRLGDGAETALIEFVDFNETYGKKSDSATAKKKSRRGGKTKSVATATEQPSEEVTEATEVVAEEVEK